MNLTASRNALVFITLIIMLSTIFAGLTPPDTNVTIQQLLNSRDMNFSFVCGDTESGCNKLFYVIDDNLGVVVQPSYSFDDFENQDLTQGELTWSFAAGDWAIVSSRSHTGTYSLSEATPSANAIFTETRIGYIDDNFFAEFWWQMDNWTGNIDGLAELQPVGGGGNVAAIGNGTVLGMTLKAEVNGGTCDLGFIPANDTWYKFIIDHNRIANTVHYYAFNLAETQIGQCRGVEITAGEIGRFGLVNDPDTGQAWFDDVNLSAGNFVLNGATEEDIDSNYFEFVQSLGGGAHQIQFASADIALNLEATNSVDFNVDGILHIQTYDEVTLNDLNVTVNFNGIDYNTTPTVDINLSGISGVKTLTFTKTGFGTRFYTDDFNAFGDFNINMLMLEDVNGIAVDFQVFDADEVTTFDNTTIQMFNHNKNNFLIGQRITDGTGNINFFINPNDANYTMRIFAGSTIDYNAMTLTVNLPKDETTGDNITGLWDLTVTGLAWQQFTDISGNQAIQIYSNTVDDYGLTVGDDNGDYFDRKYFVRFRGATTAETLQPFLVPVAQAVSTTIFTISGYTQQAVPDITIKIFKTIPSVGRVLVEQVTTDAKGEALVSLIANDSYDFEVFNSAGTLLTSKTVVATSTSIYISIDDLSFTTPPLGEGTVTVRFDPSRTRFIGSDTSLLQTIIINDSNLGLTFTSAFIYVTNTDVNGVEGNDVNIISKTITTLTNTMILNTTLRTLDGNAYDNNGQLIVYVEVLTNEGTFFAHQIYSPIGSFDIGQVLGFDLRATFGCKQTNDPIFPCAPMLLLALFISFMITIAFAIETGFASNEGMGGLFLVIMGIFTYLNWVPVGVMAIMAVTTIMLMIAIGGRSRI